MSPSIGFGNKTLVLSSQARMIEYLKELELCDVSVDINDCEADPGIVVDKFNHLLLDLEWENRISNVRLMQEKKVLDFMSLVESML
jgi:hypothetical protein